MKTDFIPVDYDYFDFEGKNYIRVIGREKQGKRICVIDSCPVYLWAILSDKLNENKIKDLMEKMQPYLPTTDNFTSKQIIKILNLEEVAKAE